MDSREMSSGLNFCKTHGCTFASTSRYAISAHRRRCAERADAEFRARGARHDLLPPPASPPPASAIFGSPAASRVSGGDSCTYGRAAAAWRLRRRRRRPRHLAACLTARCACRCLRSRSRGAATRAQKRSRASAGGRPRRLAGAHRADRRGRRREPRGGRRRRGHGGPLQPPDELRARTRARRALRR